MSIDREFNANLHHNPKACGLELIICLDKSSGCYEFNYLSVWVETESGNIYYAFDSGCSCPTPFEDFNRLSKLTPLKNIAAAEQEFFAWFEGAYSDSCCSKQDIQDLIFLLEAKLKGEKNESLEAK